MDIPTAHPPVSSCTYSSSPPSPASSVHIFNRPYAFFVFHRRSLHHRPQLLNVSPLLSNQLVHTMADAESSITDSSLAPSTTPTSLLDSVPHVPHSPVHSDKSDRRASLGLIDAARVRFSKDLYSLLRSNSKSQRIRTVLSTQTEDPESDHLVYPNYVKLASHTVDLEVQSMEGPQDERQGRSLGARIVNFLNRSRSRSRSKKRRSRSLDAFPADPMPTNLHAASLRLHARHSSLEADQDPDVAGPSRPITRSPSRPLSGTLSPAPVKPRSKKVPEQISVHNPAPTATAELVAQLVPMEATKSTSSRKGKAFNIFGILLPSPRKASFTPSPPDQLWHGSDSKTTWEAKSGSQRSQKSTRKGLPVHVEEDRNAQCLTSCVSAEHHGKGSAASGLIAPQPRRAPIHVLNPAPPMPLSAYTTKAREENDDRDAEASMLEGRCSPLCGFGVGGSSKGSHTSQEKGKEKERMRGARDRSWERPLERRGSEKRERGSEGEKARERRRDQERREKEREHITHPRRVGSPLPRDRPRESASAIAVAPIPLEKTASNRSGGSKHSGSKDHHAHGQHSAHGHAPRSGADGVAARAKRIKHGSFDFERPVSTGVTGASVGMSVKAALRNMGIGDSAPAHPLQRSLSARGPSSRRGTTEESYDPAFVPPSLPNTKPILDKGKGKVSQDVHFAEPPSRRATENSHSSSQQQQQHHSHHHHHHHHSSSHGHSSASSRDPTHNHHHTRSALTAPSHHTRDAILASPASSNNSNSSHGRDGSWGRSGGKRVVRASHGAFKFEPAVPPIPGSPADNERRKTAARPTATRPESPLSDTDAGGLSRTQQARAAGKGRSLDLGLGLSWAPSRVREEAVLKVGPRRPGTSASTSAARSRSRWRNADEEGRLGVGDASDVAAAFREALGDSAYGIFKTYVHRFDANAIPLDGPYGLLVHVERLLDGAPGVDQRRKRVLLERFLRVVQDSG
ncbi:hypothetical protein GY45DRAFT_1358424 [Cubamyces sp. BRFM 1775]|nr:hypothetical protein GY45DRAFT_1358424 [Cubamyces sp. BRFM 1775]